MRRRDLLATAGAAAATGLAGCVGYWSDDAGASEGPWVTESGPGPVERHSIRFHDPRRNRRVRRVRVAWDDSVNAVHITGLMQHGCDRPGFDRVRYDGDADRLRVHVSPVEWEGKRGCGFSAFPSFYRATVRVDGSLPGTVRVESRETVTGRQSSEPTTVERTVDRAAQRELCTTDHPAGSDAADRAHWTCPEKYVRADDSHTPKGTPTATPGE